MATDPTDVAATVKAMVRSLIAAASVDRESVARRLVGPPASPAASCTAVTEAVRATVSVPAPFEAE